MIVNARYLLGALEPRVYESYKVKNRHRQRLCYKAMSEMMTSNNLVKVKDAPPYSKELEAPVLLNPLARASYNPKTGSYQYTTKQTTQPVVDTANVKAVTEVLSSAPTAGVGVDQGERHYNCCKRLYVDTTTELISAVPSSNPTFVERNFTEAEIAYCRAQPLPAASFAARWAGKEAVFKSLGVASKGAAAAMKDIEILPDASGVPTVSLHGEAQAAADAKGIKKIHISLSHSDVSTSLHAISTLF